MRLGQLARKIGVQPSRISTFLEKKKYTLDAGSNTKLTQEQEELVKAEFNYIEEEAVPTVDGNNTTPADSPDVDDTVVEEPEAQLQSIEEAKKEIEVHNTSDEKKIAKSVNESTNAKALEEEEEKVAEEMEVIRAPKLKLDGLKVVGKIDLPEPRVKEEVAKATDDNNSEVAETPEEVKKKPIRKKTNYRKSKNRRPKKRALTLEEKQAREARVKKRKAKEKKAKEKQLKAAYYEAKMREKQYASNASKKTKKKSSKEIAEYSPKSNKPEPKSAWGKFLRWLNS